MNQISITVMFASPLGGLEPPSFRLTAERASQLRHRGYCKIEHHKLNILLGKIVVQVLHKINQQSRHPKIWPLHGKIYQWAEKGFKQPSSFWNSIKAQGVSKCPLIYHWDIFPDGIVSALDNLICVIDWNQWEIIRSHFVTKLPASLELYLDNARYK